MLANLLACLLLNCTSSPIREEQANQMGRIIVLIDSSKINSSQRKFLYRSTHRGLSAKGYLFSEENCTERSMQRLQLAELGFSQEDPDRLAELCAANSIILIKEYAGCNFKVQLSNYKKSPFYTTNHKAGSQCNAYEVVNQSLQRLTNKLPSLN